MATIARDLPDFDAALAAGLPAARAAGVPVYACEWPAIHSWSVEDRKPMIRAGKVLEICDGGAVNLA